MVSRNQRLRIKEKLLKISHNEKYSRNISILAHGLGLTIPKHVFTSWNIKTAMAWRVEAETKLWGQLINA